MQTRPHTYLFYIQYLGLRYAGWQRQKGVKTIQGSLERGIRYVLGHEDFTVLGASRTDSGVSCNRGAFELFLKHSLEIQEFIYQLNCNLPSDIRILEGNAVHKEFNVIQDVLWKEYRYHFAMGDKFHPFLAGTLSYFPGEYDLNLMKAGSKLFIGTHDFRRFCSIDKVTVNYFRTVFESSIDFHPQAGQGDMPRDSFVFKVKGEGFLRYQVRIMATALIDLGTGKISLYQIRNALQEKEAKPIAITAPANGLVLWDLAFRMDK
ncbi:tRNA pseudouridine(38-40) synthase TruA [Shivajiella indica]|uniref:tRNA pseudouridine synthase A n=1 Tax=Shivajiella indica TaxID=872115 RepID=A0ABW5BD03_9BACT